MASTHRLPEPESEPDLDRLVNQIPPIDARTSARDMYTYVPNEETGTPAPGPGPPLPSSSAEGPASAPAQSPDSYSSNSNLPLRPTAVDAAGRIDDGAEFPDMQQLGRLAPYGTGVQIWWDQEPMMFASSLRNTPFFDGID